MECCVTGLLTSVGLSGAAGARRLLPFIQSSNKGVCSATFGSNRMQHLFPASKPQRNQTLKGHAASFVLSGFTRWNTDIMTSPVGEWRGAHASAIAGIYDESQAGARAVRCVEESARNRILMHSQSFCFDVRSLCALQLRTRISEPVTSDATVVR